LIPVRTKEMRTKLFVIVAAVLLLAMVGAGVAWAWGGHRTVAADCCAVGLDCCYPPSACCGEKAAVDCCAAGLGCCDPPRPCCLSAAKAHSDCCAVGDDCCIQGKACCAAKAANSSK